MDTTAVCHARLLAGQPYHAGSSYVPAFARERWPAPAFCDRRWRCLVCPGGLGKRGRGFAHRRSVPCGDRNAHMLVWRAHTSTASGMIHLNEVDSFVMQDVLGVAAEPPLNRITAGTDRGFCDLCKDALLAARARPLESHIRCQPCAPRRLNRIEPLPWCDGRYRCIECQVSSARMDRLKKLCSDPGAHVPSARQETPLNYSETVHFAPEGGSVPAQLTGAAKNGCQICKAAVAT
eukprot:COSAG04_NODE_3255_length_3004_cov_2.042341_2_plen_235_part_00